MKKLIIASAVCAGIFGSSMAQAETHQIFDNWESRSYAQAKLGFADLGTSDDGIAVTGTFGLDVPSIDEYLAFEVDVMKTLTDGESTYPSAFGSTTVEASAFGFGGYAVATYDEMPVEGLKPYVRLGLAYTSIDISAGNSMVNVSGETSDFGIGYGAGLKYDLGASVPSLKNVEALVEFNSTEVDVISAGVGYHF